ncbi:MAG: hypothetical protein R2860_11160 [Desulfobacterales bacterium]
MLLARQTPAFLFNRFPGSSLKKSQIWLYYFLLENNDLTKSNMTASTKVHQIFKIGEARKYPVMMRTGVR